MNFEAILTAVCLFVGVVVWFARLEGRINNCEQRNDDLKDDITDLRSKHEALDNRIVDKLSNVEKSLAKIEGRLSINNNEGK